MPSLSKHAFIPASVKLEFLFDHAGCAPRTFNIYSAVPWPEHGNRLNARFRAIGNFVLYQLGLTLANVADNSYFKIVV